MSMKLSEKEKSIVNYLSNKEVVTWEEMAQFSKNPQNVKLSSVQKGISELKRKFQAAGEPIPFNTKFESLSKKAQGVQQAEYANQIHEQKLVQVRATPAGKLIPAASELHPAQHDFKVIRETRSIQTKHGRHLLAEDEFEIFKYIHNNPGKIIKISDLRDKVVFHNYGSKLPPRWFDVIMRRVNNIRKQIPELKNRLMTIKADETAYVFQ